MKIADLKMADFLDKIYRDSPISQLIEDNFDVTYFSGDDGVFMEINIKKTQESEEVCEPDWIPQ